jgi:ATP-dependent DNA helicase DinG
MTKTIDDFITADMQAHIRSEIAHAKGNEVFFLGYTNEEKIVFDVKTMSRGNQSRVAACTEDVEAGNVLIHNHPGDDLSPSDADVDLSSFFATLGVGSFIVNNDVSDIYVLVEPRSRKQKNDLSNEEVSRVFIDGGAISQALSAYEFRPEQLNMAHHVCGALNARGVSLIEAGTGTGKTFAYLIPAILYALLNKERIVVSTNTINLQEQLIHKDIPFLQKALGRSFRATLVKGRGNYLCCRKLQAEMEQYEIFADDDRAEFDRLYAWAQKTRDGSISDLNYVPEAEVWERLCSEGDSCLRIKCPFYKQCFYHASRRDAAISELIVVNHHILFADLALRQELGDISEHLLLPPFQSVIIDEAHHVEESATSYFSRRLSRFGIRKIIKRLYAVRGRKKRGFLVFLERRVARSEHLLRKQIDELKTTLMHVSVKTEDLFESFSEFFSVYFASKNERKDFLTLTPELIHSIEYRDIIQDNMSALRALLSELFDALKNLLALLEKKKKSNEPNRQNDWATVHSMAVKVADMIALATLFLNYDRDDLVRWIECRKQKNGAYETFFRSAPIEIREMLQKTLFADCNCVVLTSATLSVEGNLNYIKKRLGLDRTRAVEEKSSISCSEFMLPSSFDYKRQVFLGVFEHMPAPTESGFEASLQKNIFKTLSLTGGKAFVLFTSYYLLNKMAKALAAPLGAYGIDLLKQGDTTRHKILGQFRQNTNSVLFGTDSFWEGVDVEGESLSNVLIPRLPFQVPNDPVVEARCESIKKRGGNPFLEYTVPQAVIKFKQGFGRLIRSKNDFGAVLIFDSRVINKQYGVKFLNSLPDCSITCGSSDAVLSGLEQFYQDFKRTDTIDGTDFALME